MRTAKKIIIFSLIALILAGGCVFGYLWLKSDSAQKLKAVSDELDEYKAVYEPLGAILTGYALVQNEKYGNLITEDDLTAVDMTENCSANMITDIDEITGKYYRIDISAGTVLTYDMIMDFPQESDERAFDVITKFNPIGLEPNDFVDIRFAMPSGEDYIALSHKRVEGIYGGVLKLIMSEYDIMIYNSLIVDQILFKGSIIYATKYVEPGGQKAAATNYPISAEIIRILHKNPNVYNISPLEIMTANRIDMENAYYEYAEDELKKTLIESGKNEIPSRIQNGESEYRTQKEIEEQKLLEEAIINGG